MNKGEENAMNEIFGKGSKLSVTESAQGEFIDLTTGRNCPICHKNGRKSVMTRTNENELYKCKICGNSLAEETIIQMWKVIKVQEA